MYIYSHIHIVRRQTQYCAQCVCYYGTRLCLSWFTVCAIMVHSVCYYGGCTVCAYYGAQCELVWCTVCVYYGAQCVRLWCAVCDIMLHSVFMLMHSVFMMLHSVCTLSLQLYRGSSTEHSQYYIIRGDYINRLIYIYIYIYRNTR